jgi:peptidoglycan/xylan/chitin deacetylase (PgdA/CDA1 family)
MLSSLLSTITGLRDEWRSLRVGYPDFVTRDVESVPVGDVPVFTFHTIEPEPFEAQLRHLQRNGYRTIDGAALLRHLRGREAAPPGAVMLTIDDGRKSVWTYGVPLLRRYGFVATVYLIPGYVQPGSGLDATLEDVWSERMAASELKVHDPELMNWQEIRAAQESGVIDCQSHTLFHHRVPTGPSLKGFVGPTTRDAVFDLPVPAGEEPRLVAANIGLVLGMPLYEASPLMLGRRRYHPEPAVVQACLDLVRSRGGAEFFATSDAHKALRRTHDAAIATHGGGRIEDPEDACCAMRDDLAGSRQAIEAALGGKPCTQLCFPYTAGSAEAVEAARAIGFEAAFWGTMAGRRINRADDDPMRIVRLKNDFIHRLPGEGRRRLTSIILDKVRRRVTGGPVH